MKRLIPIIVLLFASAAAAQDQPNAVLVDELGFRNSQSNDALQVVVDRFQTEVRHGGKGVVILTGSPLTNHLNKRRIEGCGIMLHYPADNLVFVFEPEAKDHLLEFWIVPLTNTDQRFIPKPLDYRLPDLTGPVELTASMYLDDFCPRKFDLEWYSHFLKDNPTFSGKAVIDTTTRRSFYQRVQRARNELKKYGLDAKRVRFEFRHFHGERDEQYWLIPHPKK